MKVNKYFYTRVVEGAFSLLLLCTFVQAEVFVDCAQALDVIPKFLVVEEIEKKLPVEEKINLNKNQPAKVEDKKLLFGSGLRKTGGLEKITGGKKTPKLTEKLITLKKEKNNLQLHTTDEYTQWKQELIGKDNALLLAIKAIPITQRDNVLLTALFGELILLKTILPVTQGWRATAQAGYSGLEGKILGALNFSTAEHARTAIMAFGRVEPLLIEELIKTWRGWGNVNSSDPQGYVLITELFNYMVAIFKYYFEDICNGKSFVAKKEGGSDARADINRVLAFYKIMSPFLREAKLTQDEALLFGDQTDIAVESFLSGIEKTLLELRTLCNDPCIKAGLILLGLNETEVNEALKTETSNRVWCRSGNYVKDNVIKNDKKHTPWTVCESVEFDNDGYVKSFVTEYKMFTSADPETLGKKYYYPFNFDVTRIELLANKVAKIKEKDSLEYRVASMRFLNAINTLVGYALSNSTCPVCFSSDLAISFERAQEMRKKLATAKNSMKNIPDSNSKRHATTGLAILEKIIDKERSYDVYTAYQNQSFDNKVSKNVTQEQELLKVDLKNNPLQQLVTAGINDTRLLRGCFWVRRHFELAQKWLEN